ncbi:MAG: DJ-1/PfpI family protein [Methanoregulaceae archaeon]
MKIAFVMYDGLTLLDFAGVYDPLTRLKTMGFLPDLTYTVCSTKETVRTSEGLLIRADLAGCDLAEFDYVLIPGGDGIRDLLGDREFLTWITRRSEKTVTAAVCGGSLLLGAAGLLRDRRATTHPELRGVLGHFAREVSSDRIVEDGRIITAGGVTAAIDLGLYLCEKIGGLQVREQVQKQMDYRNYAAR